LEERQILTERFSDNYYGTQNHKMKFAL